MSKTRKRRPGRDITSKATLGVVATAVVTLVTVQLLVQLPEYLGALKVRVLSRVNLIMTLNKPQE
jgi:hypothetical protein